MKATRLEGERLSMVTKYGAVMVFDMRTRWQRFKFYVWYFRYLMLWRDPIRTVDGVTVRTYGE